MPVQYFPALFTQVYQGNRWCAARCQVHLDQQPPLFGKAGFFFGNWALVQTGANIIFGSACERLQNMIQWKWVGLLCVPRQFKGVWGVDMPVRLSFSYSFDLVLFKQTHIEVLKAAIVECLGIREKKPFSRRAGTFLRETLYSCQSDLKLGYKTTIEEKQVLDFGYWQEFFPRENRGSQGILCSWQWGDNTYNWGQRWFQWEVTPVPAQEVWEGCFGKSRRPLALVCTRILYRA